MAGAANAAGELAATQTTTRSTWRRGAASSGVTAVIPRAMTSRSQPAVVMAAAGVAGAPGGAGWQRASLSRSATAMAGGGTGGAPSELFVVADDVTVDRAGIELRARPVTVAAADATAATTVTARRQRVDCDVRQESSEAASLAAGVAATTLAAGVSPPPPPPLPHHRLALPAVGVPPFQFSPTARRPVPPAGGSVVTVLFFHPLSLFF